MKALDKPRLAALSRTESGEEERLEQQMSVLWGLRTLHISGDSGGAEREGLSRC